MNISKGLLNMELYSENQYLNQMILFELLLFTVCRKRLKFVCKLKT